MTTKDIMIIVIVSIWIIATLITGLLALIFKEKYKNYKTQSELIKNQFVQEENRFELKEQKIEFDLPKDEKCYFFQDNVDLKNVKLKNKKVKSNYKKDLKESNVNCSIYVTNKRMMVKLNDQYLQYDLTNTVYCHYILKYFKKNWIFLIQIEINDDIYIVGSLEFSLLLTLKEITKKEG
ncbi:hypothetical protein [Spiroplasma endosymbiont of Diplazon laetatorius]|uniref:hypothetical protein n=1 Tax=Spiroplasma endosymbiont of Diplazon laetatorius TaxID=3066322 RepID=UPI0030D5B24C